MLRNLSKDLSGEATAAEFQTTHNKKLPLGRDVFHSRRKGSFYIQTIKTEQNFLIF